jgi:hypothetical protein
MSRKSRGSQEDPPAPFEPQSRLPTEPWMRYTGVSKIAALIVWFRMPRRVRRQSLRSAWIAMLVFAALIAVLLVVIGLIKLIVDWLLHG